MRNCNPDPGRGQPLPSFDHSLLVLRHPLEVARFIATAERISVDTPTAAVVIEHGDQSCCAVEPVQDTVARLLANRLLALFDLRRDDA